MIMANYNHWYIYGSMIHSFINIYIKLNISEISHTLFVNISSCDSYDKGIIVISPQRKTK